MAGDDHRVPISDEELELYETAAAAATQPPWILEDPIIWGADGLELVATVNRPADLSLIALTRTAIPRLTDEIRTLRKRISILETSNKYLLTTTGERKGQRG